MVDGPVGVVEASVGDVVFVPWCGEHPYFAVCGGEHGEDGVGYDFVVDEGGFVYDGEVDG